MLQEIKEDGDTGGPEAVVSSAKSEETNPLQTQYGMLLVQYLQPDFN